MTFLTPLTKLSSRIASLCIAVLLTAAGTSAAWAGEADDLQIMIERARRGADDLKRLDDQHAVQDEVTLLNVWLDEAWRLRSEQKYDEVRVVLDRTDAQADMIRERITAAKLSSDAAAKETAARNARAKVEQTRKDIQAALLEKARMEGRNK
jgi:hypothetical protein